MSMLACVWTHQLNSHSPYSIPMRLSSYQQLSSMPNITQLHPSSRMRAHAGSVPDHAINALTRFKSSPAGSKLLQLQWNC
jgi:hypothetical protein